MTNPVPDDFLPKLLIAFEQSQIQVDLLTRAVMGLAGGVDPRARELAAQMVENSLSTPRPQLLQGAEVTAVLDADAEKLVASLARAIRGAGRVLPPPIVE